MQMSGARPEAGEVARNFQSAISLIRPRATVLEGGFLVSGLFLPSPRPERSEWLETR